MISSIKNAYFVNVVTSFKNLDLTLLLTCLTAHNSATLWTYVASCEPLLHALVMVYMGRMAWQDYYLIPYHLLVAN
jgi:hypothetical protein